jgi:hypothetical protein
MTIWQVIQPQLHHPGIVENREMPMYEYTAASAVWPRKANVTEVVDLPWGDRLYQE